MIDHALYSPLLAPVDFFLSAKIKNKLTGISVAQGRLKRA
jgi:hypothetical protein